MPNIKTSAIIPAAGSGHRLKKKVKKQFSKINGKPLFYFCLNSFQNSSSVDEIILVVSKDNIDFVKTEIRGIPLTKSLKVVEGGDLRQNSVRKGFEAVNPDAQVVIIHDAARPFVRPSFIDKIISEANTKECVISALLSKDTLKIGDNDIVKTTLSRGSIWQAQTPQAFKYEILKDCYEKVKIKNNIYTDEAQIAEHAGYKVHIIEGSGYNFKVTYPEDMRLAELIILNGWEYT